MSSTEQEDVRQEIRRGRPRSEAVERSIIEAVVNLLEEGAPLTEISIERIARTAGVGKATIYRRWKGKEELLCDVMKAIEPVDPPLPGTSVRDDLVAMLESLRQRGLAQRSSALLHNVFAQMKSSPKLWDVYHDTVVVARREMGRELIARGVAEGAIRADVPIDVLNDILVGPMLLRTVMRPDAELPEDLSERLVDLALQGLKPQL
ncbi:TetR/AcrR family transcriptional regulator [Streptomyces sp. NPDC050738]|uniref:TetR/AcrR family transcriptional regulator n=1 Tax=Streptomyces sp. NPDC050738 TaxID=3154744 RepID=UPI00342BC1F1